MIQQKHTPVMVKEVIEYLNIKKGGIYVDATVGRGGHFREILSLVDKEGLVIGIDKDEENINYLKNEIKNCSNVRLIKRDYRNIDEVLSVNLKIDGILYDCGLCRTQISQPERGFSFFYNGLLDMRYDRTHKLTAYDVVNTYGLNDLAGIFRKYGDEEDSIRISEKIIEIRKMSPIRTTKELAAIVINSKRFKRRIHPATKVFQAIRIEVNDEFNALNESLEKAITYLKKGGRIVVISYHSGEDRIIKSLLKSESSEEPQTIKILTKKVVVPSREEIKSNRSARSAKLRCAEKVN